MKVLFAARDGSYKNVLYPDLEIASDICSSNTEATEEIDLEDLIERHRCLITLSHAGYIKRRPADSYTAQNRGGKGIIGMTTRDDDNVESMFVCSSHDTIMLFSNLGRVYRMKAYEIPEGSRTSKGLNIINLLPLMEGEKITVMLPVPPFESDNYVNMVTKKGVIKRTAITSKIIPNKMKMRLYGIKRKVIPTKTKINPSMRIAALVQLGSNTDIASVHPTTISTTLEAMTS